MLFYVTSNLPTHDSQRYNKTTLQFLEISLVNEFWNITWSVIDACQFKSLKQNRTVRSTQWWPVHWVIDRMTENEIIPEVENIWTQTRARMPIDPTLRYSTSSVTHIRMPPKYFINIIYYLYLWSCDFHLTRQKRIKQLKNWTQWCFAGHGFITHWSILKSALGNCLTVYSYWPYWPTLAEVAQTIPLK